MKKQILLASLLAASAIGFAQQWTTNGTNIFNANTGNVKIGGVMVPKQKLDVQGNIAISGGIGQLVFDGMDGYMNWGHAAGGDMRFRVMNFQGNLSQGVVERMIIQGSTGNIGINTSSPTEKLNVNGNIRCDAGTLQYGLNYTRTEKMDNAGDYVQSSGFNAGATTQSGFFETNSPQNYPIAGSNWWHLLNVRHSNPANNYAMQFAGTFFDQDLYFRKTNNSATTGWSKVIMADANGKVRIDGKLQIGNTTQTTGPHTDAMLTVGGTTGKLVAKQIYVTASNWADFVFAKDYKLPNLKDVEAYYKLNQHLPEIPTTKEVEENGISVGEMNKLLLQKIEELTIYVVEQQKQIDALKLGKK